MRKITVSILAAIFALAIAGASAVSAEEEKWYSGTIEVGANTALDKLHSDESGAKGGAEYNSLFDKKWTTHIGGSLEFDKNGVAFEGDALYEDGDDQEYAGRLSLGRILIYKTEYNRFMHRLDHDYMENLNAHVFPPAASGWSNWASHPDLVAGIADPRRRIVGAANVYNTDFNPEEQFEITRSLWENEIRLNIPQLPELKFTLNHRFEDRKGHKQAMTNNKCISCHIVSMAKKIHEKTNDFTPKVSLQLGTLAFEASYMHREFDVNDEDLSFATNDLRKGWAPDRVQYGKYGANNTGGAPYYQEVDFSRTPDSTKDTFKLKSRWDINQDNTVVASYIYSKSTNEAVDHDYDILKGYFDEDIELDSHLAQIKWHSRFSKAISFNVYGKYQNLDNDEPWIHKVRQGATPPDDYVYWDYDYKRKSGYDSDKWAAGADVTWRLSRDLKLGFGYEFKYEDRDNYDIHSVTEDTTEHILDFNADWHVMHGLKLDFSTELEFVDDQYMFKNATCTPNGHLGYYAGPGSDRYTPENAYEETIYGQRTADRTNLPDFVIQPNLKVHWHVMNGVNTSFHVKYRYAENSDVDGRDWQQDQVTAGFNVVLTPIENLVVSAGYNYFYDKYESQYCIAIYDG